ncbi:GTPase HflX [Anaerocolumna sedimenticola]|uniref:GTPase HflX n=1 Tax=Anaerocolumna sedimenticola TaxID=2696063 RepID=A0A6P1TSM1_9FIRM|nr:GTPase HflX [Anaerocolumna sedimenticola]QHQ63483.1 GTPase HflX [Anaerocolumna sedimenticola]
MEQREKALLIGANLNDNEDFTNSMEELRNLAEACDIDTVSEVSQNLSRINAQYYLGKGKILEISELAKEIGVDLVIFNDELSPSQVRNLEETVECRVIDRTVLILDIFAQRAKTKEAQLQVEIAKLQYMLPRLIGSAEALGRQGGGAGLKNKGSGEKKLELDRRKLEDRISALNKELELLVSRRQNQRKWRKKNEIPVVALVGYTNAGKSTIMNVMLDLYNPNAEKKVFEKDMLFATLETSVRNITLPDNKNFLLTDTVGFISKLPHHLVKAFRSTLEEVAEADLLIHVIDYSNPNYKEQMKVTQETLKELGADQIPVIYAFNKVDLAKGYQDNADMDSMGRDGMDTDNADGDNIDMVNTLLDLNRELSIQDSVIISAKKKIGMDGLIAAIKKHVFADYVKLELRIPYQNGNVVSYLNDHASILSSQYENDGIWIVAECKKTDYEKLKVYEAAPGL